jgi:hypothetical protein
MAPLKEFAAGKLPPGSTARELMLTENDEITASEFLVKMAVWMRLVRRELEQ